MNTIEMDMAIVQAEEDIAVLTQFIMQVTGYIKSSSRILESSVAIDVRARVKNDIDAYSHQQRVLVRMLQREQRILQRLQDQQKIFDTARASQN